MKALIPRLDRVFIYTCNGKYSKKWIKRFIRYIRINRETGCWEWIGPCYKNGYGRFNVRKNGKYKTHKAYRAAMEMATGILIPEGMCVCHHCDNPRCINVLVCLFLGTTQENMTDMISKGRGNKSTGEKHGGATHTWIEIKEIRRLWLTDKYTQRQLANIFKFDQPNISAIILNKKWHDPDYTPDKSINHTKKLTEEQVNKIRSDYATGEYTYKQLADRFNICVMEICRIINNKRRIFKNVA